MSMQPMGLDQRLQLMEMELQNLRQRNGGAMQWDLTTSRRSLWVLLRFR